MPAVVARRRSTPGVAWGGPDAPPSDDEGGGGGWVDLVTAENDIEAHLLTGRLCEAGIETRTVKDRSAPGAWLYGGSNPWAPVTVLVRRVHVDDAKIVLAEISWVGPSAGEHGPGPAQGSARRFHSILWWAAALALGVVFTALGLARTAESLQSCARADHCTGATP